MFPGTSAFQRFEYPSRLPEAAQAGAFALAERAMRALGFDHGAFNVEMFWQPATGRFQVIEINPRLAAQFGDLYEKVDGTQPVPRAGRPHRRAARRAGRAAKARSAPRRASCSASSTARVKIAPDAQRRSDWLSARYPDATLHTFIKHGDSRWRETKWLGSYRYAIVNLGGADHDDIGRRFDDICRHVRFERRGPVRFVAGFDALRSGR